MLTYWKKEFGRVVSDLANGKEFVPASKNLYIPQDRRLVCLMQSYVPIVISMENGSKKICVK